MPPSPNLPHRVLRVLPRWPQILNHVQSCLAGGSASLKSGGPSCNRKKEAKKQRSKEAEKRCRHLSSQTLALQKPLQPYFSSALFKMACAECLTQPCVAYSSLKCNVAESSFLTFLLTLAVLTMPGTLILPSSDRSSRSRAALHGLNMRS